MPITCREQIAAHYGLVPRKRKPWQFEGKCPNCHHGGFSIAAPNQGPNAPRHIWWCNCHRCGCPPEVVRAAMIRDGISEDCLGNWKKHSSAPAIPQDPVGVLKAAMRRVLADTKIRALADLKIRMLEVVDEEPAPEDYDAFVAFAARAGVSRSKRYEAAERWGRSATEVDTPAEGNLSTGRRSEAKSAVPVRDAQEAEPSRFGTEARPGSGQQTLDDKPGADYKPAA